jgi:hypothetical protein
MTYVARTWAKVVSFFSLLANLLLQAIVESYSKRALLINVLGEAEPSDESSTKKLKVQFLGMYGDLYNLRY